MSKICGYSCEHNKSGVCQISVCSKKSNMKDKTETELFRETWYEISQIRQLQQENKQLKEIIKENTILVKDEYGNYQECNIKPLEMKQKYEKLKNNWNKLKEYLINDINDINGNRVAEYEDSRKESETISPIYTLMEDKSKTMKEVLDKMQELEQGSDSNGNN